MYITKVDINTNRGEEYGRESTLTKSQFTKHNTNSCEGYNLYIIYICYKRFLFFSNGERREYMSHYLLLDFTFPYSKPESCFGLIIHTPI